MLKRSEIRKALVIGACPPRLGSPGSPLTPDEIKSPTLEKSPVDVSESEEPWNTCRILGTGEILKIKLVVVEIYRVKDRFNQFGEPALFFTLPF